MLWGTGLGSMASYATTTGGKWVRTLGLSGALCAFLTATTVMASDLPSAPPPVAPAPASGWTYQVSLYGWATSLTGDVGVRNLPTTSIDDLFRAC